MDTTSLSLPSSSSLSSSGNITDDLQKYGIDIGILVHYHEISFNFAISISGAPVWRLFGEDSGELRVNDETEWSSA